MSAWIDGAWVELVQDAPINGYTVSADDLPVLSTVTLCAAQPGVGTTQLEVARPYLTKKREGRRVAKYATGEGVIAVVFATCPQPL